MKSRRERRAEARQSKVPFEPQYNGQNPRTYEETYNVGYERFNNRYITIREIEKTE